MKFKKLERTKKSSFVLDQLVKKLKSEEFEVGDQLPTEPELAEAMGVSRTSVREALAALRLGGVIISKPGHGTYISDKLEEGEGHLENRALSILKRNHNPKEMFEARKVIEPSIAIFAMKEVRAPNLNELKNILEKMDKAVTSNDKETFISLNKRFHLSIAKATRNKAIEDIMEGVLSYMEEDLWKEERKYYYEEDGGDLRESLTLHEGILDAMKKGDEEAVSKELEAHFNYITEGDR